MKISMTDFAAGRHFDNPDFGGTKIPCTVDFFVSHPQIRAASGATLLDGYAPFCKHLFVENFAGAKAGVARITSRNDMRLHTDYVARREGELPVLTRWFDSLDVDPAITPFLDVILYSSEHLAMEGAEVDGDWGIVSINSASAAEEAPMNPITMMRNALDKDEGGSGVPLDKAEYARAVAYWSEYATIR